MSNRKTSLQFLYRVPANLGADIGSSVALEINGSVYAPIHDISGNITTLIYNKSLYEHYRYSAFGERKVITSHGNYLSTDNPWQFSSKRYDEESSLVYFGRRYYDPSLGRWLTCDPIGFADGMNLYAYVCNDPLNNIAYLYALIQKKCFIDLGM